MTDSFTSLRPAPPWPAMPLPAMPFADGGPWLTLWRVYWVDLPLAWADAMDGFLQGAAAPVAEEAGPVPAPSPALALALAEPATSAAAIALGLGCGDFAGEALDAGTPDRLRDEAADDAGQGPARIPPSDA